MKTRIFNYRHLICVWITIIFIALSVLVYNSAFYRVGDSIIDFFNSIIYYFCFIFGLNSPFDITVNNLPIYPGWVYDTPVTMLPETLEIFAQCWEIFIVQIFEFDNFMAYLYDLSDIVAVVSKALLLFVPIYLLLTWVSSFNETTNNDYNVDSSLLKVFKNV
ncbi:MAG: hypothetical protein IJF72_01100, partial [Clostridia bacterium]|nr:hypothetical protein [Clostridia bacterium]